MPTDLEEIRPGVFVEKRYYTRCTGCGMMFGPWFYEPEKPGWRCAACENRIHPEEAFRCAACQHRSLLVEEP
jgi:hypothetical protein